MTDWQPVADVDFETRSESVAAFAAALAGKPAAVASEPAQRVPATFAFTVLSRPEVLRVLEGLAADRDAVLVHQAQQFEYFAPLLPDSRYRAVIDWHQVPERADRIVVRARLQDTDGAEVQRLRAEIVLFENRRDHEGAPSA
ncbi:hypothetical protein H1W37_08060 [Stappia taiwanensis]|uniref:MaoC family dehydratase n=1 Tax=Stappia taiwanensis TaxID=992267 RepID=A0A838XXU1_9HYPH|nr:hypothetical protein [Stappia taiwanensis]MBA4611600.1 hypothetical protein [Stappia taiwanensis]